MAASARPTASTRNTASRPVAAAPKAPRTLRRQLGAVISSAVAALLGILPHVLHHAGPLAGAALVAGTGGTLLFGAVGLFASIPFLLRVHRRCGNWSTPGALLAVFAVVFAVSTLVIGPAITGENRATSKSTTYQTAPGAPASAGHDGHH
jgi:hypothetical protein